MKRNIVLLAVFLMLLTGAVWGQAEFVEVRGKVEIRPESGSWTAATVGTVIDENTVISTGFSASAVLEYAGSTVEVEQLTRMAFENMVENDDGVETEISLSVGRMSANVRKSEGREQNFQVRSPISTAAVRGTEFTFDGELVEVQEGIVALRNAYGQQRSILGGQRSRVSGRVGVPTDPAAEAQQQSATSTAATGGDGDGDGATTTTGRQSRGSVVISVQ